MDALTDDALRTQAATALRALPMEIRLIPEEGQLVIELVGEVAAILVLGQESKGPRSEGLGADRLTLVAGA